MMMLKKNIRFLLIISLFSLCIPAARSMDNIPPISKTKSNESIGTPGNIPVLSVDSLSSADIEKSNNADKSYFAAFKEKLMSVGKNLPSYETLKKLTASMAVVTFSKYATDSINNYFGNSLSGYAINASAQLFLLIFIQMYEAWQKGELDTMKNLKKLLPVDVLTKSYWQKNKLLVLLQYGCIAVNCVAPYIGLSQTYPVGFSLFIQALLYDDEVKESIVANLYSILSSWSVQFAQIGIANLPDLASFTQTAKLPQEVQDTILSLPKEKAYDFMQSFYKLVKSLQ